MQPNRADEPPASTLDHFPSLDDVLVNELRASFAVRALRGDVPMSSGLARSYLFNLLRLALKAVGDYNEARAHYAELIRGFRVAPFMGCTDAFEDCINATHRGYLFAESLRTAIPEVDGVPPLDDAAKQRLKAIASLVNRVNEMRNAIEHREKDLMSRDRPDADAAYLSFGEANIFVANEAMSYKELARVIRALFDLVWSLVPPDGAPGMVEHG